MTERDFDYELSADLAADEIDEMRTELAQLRAELALLRPLAEAAVAWEAVEKSSGVVRAYKLLSLKQAALAYARAQAQAGEGA